MKKQNNSIVLSQSSQRLFVAAVLGGWGVETLAVVHELATNYTSQGTWIFQASTWLFPVLIFVASVGFAAKRYGNWLQRTFFGTVLSTMVLSAYGALEWIDTYWYNTYTRNHPIGDDASYWQTFGDQWALMIAVLAVYIALLMWAGKGDS